jgi:hypothetical protein
MATTVCWARCAAIGGLVAGIHCLISLPFLFFGPMLTTPSHGGAVGWIWWLLESPALAVCWATGLWDGLVGRASTAFGQYLVFILLAVPIWFAYGFVGCCAVQYVRHARQ